MYNPENKEKVNTRRTGNIFMSAYFHSTYADNIVAANGPRKPESHPARDSPQAKPAL